MIVVIILLYVIFGCQMGMNVVYCLIVLSFGYIIVRLEVDLIVVIIGGIFLFGIDVGRSYGN